MATPVYRARLVHTDGTVTTTFGPELMADTITYTLNEQDQFDLTFPKNAFAPTDFGVLVTDNGGGVALRELQIIDTANGNALVAWGPIVGLTGAGSQGDVQMHCEGVDWYLFRRFLDGTVTQFLTNEEFEDDFTDWDDWNGDPPGTGDSTAFSIDANRVFLGDKSAKLVQSGGVEFEADEFITQSVAVAGGTLGRALVLSGWFWLPAAVTPAIEGRGLYVEQRATGDVFVDNNYYPIDNATPTGQWIKAHTTVFVPAGDTNTIIVRAYAPADGTIFWDDIKLVQFDSFGFVDITTDENVALDIGPLVTHLVDELQQSEWGKSGLNISTTPTDIGKTVTKTYFFSEHVQFDQALEEYVNRDDGIDYCIFYDADGGTRDFQNFNHKRGTDLTGSVTLSYVAGDPDNSNCANYRWTQDGANCITQQTILGEDSGPDREEYTQGFGENMDGLVLQDVRQSPQDTEVRSLKAMTTARLNLFSRTAPIALEMDIKPSAYIADFLGSGMGATGINCGDLVAVDIQDGYFTGLFAGAAATYRIMQLKLNCRKNVLTVKLALDNLDTI